MFYGHVAFFPWPRGIFLVLRPMAINGTKRSHVRVARTSRLQFREGAMLLLTCCILCIIGGLSLAPSRLLFHALPGFSVDGERPRTATILVETRSGECGRFTFDNDSGQIHPDAEICNPGSAPDMRPTGATGIAAISESSQRK
jgi:hypothetical protein